LNVCAKTSEKDIERRPQRMGNFGAVIFFPKYFALGSPGVTPQYFSKILCTNVQRKLDLILYHICGVFYLIKEYQKCDI